MQKYKYTGQTIKRLLLLFIASFFALSFAESEGATLMNWHERLTLASSADVATIDAGLTPRPAELYDKLPLLLKPNQDQRILLNEPYDKLFLACAKQPHKPEVTPNPIVLTEFDQVMHGISTLTTLDKGLKTSLTRKLDNAQEAYERGQPCTALNLLDAYLNETQALRRSSLIPTAEQLYTSGRLLRHDLASRLSKGITCPGYERINSGVSVDVLESDNTHVRGRITFGEPKMWNVTAGGETFTQVDIPGSIPVGQVGLPGVPAISRLLGFPRGANISISTSSPVIAEKIRLNLYPFQHEPADARTQFDPFGNPPFVKDNEAYASSGPFPSNICTVQRLGQVRDLPVSQLNCSAAQYDPKAQILTLFRSLDFEVRFEGGSGFFITKASLGPFEPSPDGYTPVLINKKDILRYVDKSQPDTQCDGEEFIIFTAPDLVTAAEGLAQWKRTKGIATTVITVGASMSADDIRDLIRDRFDHCKVRVSYVLLFGDAESIPTFYVSTEFAPQTGSDYRYAAYPQFFFDILPDFGVGRIPVDTLDQAWDVVNKIIAYESDPPADDAFYHNVTLASEFQCCRSDVPPFGVLPPTGWDQRGFIETSEFVRDMLMSQGYTVQRIYTRTTDPLYLKDDTPKRYYDGTLLPVDLGENSGFSWNGSKQDIVDAWNAGPLSAGRFLIMHRDHGSWDRWSHPELTKGDIDTLFETTPHLPVVFSMNCSTGFFDNETNPSGNRSATLPNYYPYGLAVANETYFAERLLRLRNGGAVGVIAATRDSPSWANNALARGLFDAVWPGTLPTYGTSNSIRRLGDMLNYAKIYLLTAMSAPDVEVDVDALADVGSELSLWHVIGDPTLEMWTSRPAMLFEHYELLDSLVDALILKYGVEGATITALQVRSNGDSDTSNVEMLPIGRGQVKNGVATLTFVNQPWSNVPILLSASKANKVSRIITPQGGRIY
jgi:hypothetical protein